MAITTKFSCRDVCQVVNLADLHVQVTQANAEARHC